MKQEELVKAIDYEAVVRGVWETYQWKAASGQFYVDLLYTGNAQHGAFTFPGDTETAAWQAAYEWTLQRQEEIRQIDAEIEWVTECSIISPKMEQLYRDRAWEFSAEYLKRIETSKRVLVRLQSIRAELTRGMSAQEVSE